MFFSLDDLLTKSAPNLEGLHPSIEAKAKNIIYLAYQEGIEVQICQGYRSIDYQNELYAQGRTAPGEIVTNAKGGESYHNFGLAIDYCLRVNGEVSWDLTDDWKRVAEIGKEMGFSWGGDWTSFKDYSHLEDSYGYTLAQLRAGEVPPVEMVEDLRAKAEASQQPKGWGPMDEWLQNTLISVIQSLANKGKLGDPDYWIRQVKEGKPENLVGLSIILFDRI